VHAITEELAKGPSPAEAAPSSTVEAAKEAPTQAVENAPEHKDAQNTEKIEAALPDSLTTDQAVIP
jgi:hypothetical protein